MSNFFRDFKPIPSTASQSGAAAVTASETEEKKTTTEDEDTQIDSYPTLESGKPLP